ncbi:MAG: hypothetical protein IK062_06570 [Selenomonadaceae bacterium]|nr:hypothetical protein [Selenomonadaceae bacterium]
MIPWLIAGAVGALVASEVMDDNKKELQTSKSREQVSASDVPADIRAQIEGGNFSSNSGEYFSSAQEYYQAGNEYCYGWNGRSVNKSKAKELYLEASSRGHGGAATQLRNIWGIY